MKSPIQEYLERLHAKYAELREGAVATYIPELAKADPEWFGICVATTDGHIYEVGDTRQPFTIQSISKPFTYGLALEDRGRDAVLAKIGVEPTGDAFNSISLAPGTGRPLNPMINAGAIAAASLVAGYSPDDKLNRLLGVYSLYAGRQLSLDYAVYESERATGHRNRAIGHMLRNFDIISEDPESALDLYFRQCSVSVDCRDLSIMAATLANDGLNPLTGERALRTDFIEDILSIMSTCGMYDYAGQWLYSVGMPAKSGVAGGVLVVLPGQLGIGVFSPRLDARGNSVRGVQVCTDLSRDLQLHLLRVARSSRSAIRAQYSLAGVRSKRRRPEREEEILREFGKCVWVYELQGDFLLPAMEAVVRRIVEHSAVLDVAVLDLKRVTQIGEPAARILVDLVRRLQERDKQLVLVSGQGHSR
ncbi:MAG: glutaminase A, partial [Candidatus Methylomirabilis sp.]